MVSFKFKHRLPVKHSCDADLDIKHDRESHLAELLVSRQSEVLARCSIHVQKNDGLCTLHLDRCTCTGLTDASAW